MPMMRTTTKRIMFLKLCRQSHFQRVILMSGSIFSGWSRVDNPAEVSICHLLSLIFIRIILIIRIIFIRIIRIIFKRIIGNPDDFQTGVKLARALGCPIPADLHTHHSSIIDCLRLFCIIVLSVDFFCKVFHVTRQKLLRN